jgi:hypothetical protein
VTRQRFSRTPTPATRANSAPLSLAAQVFPLSIDASGLFLKQADGTPFILLGDTPWSLAVNCSNAQIDSYLNDRAAKGCNAIMINAVEKGYSSQTPIYRNVDGVDPFTVMSPVNWTLNSSYWNRVDYIVNECKARGMVCIINPAYTGYGSGSDGWLGDYSGASDATLQAYGAALANRYTQGNVIWCLGGDDANDTEAAGNYGSGTTPNRTKQWQIVLGIRSVRTTDLVTGHTARNTTGTVSGEAFKAWTTGYTGFNLNNTYLLDNANDDGVALANTAYGRTGYPFFMMEAGYENVDGSDPSGPIPAIQTVLRGGITGFFGGHDALWHMGSYSPNNSGAASVLSTYLAGSWLRYQYLASLLKSYGWHKLRPSTGTALVTTALGTGASAICPALATDGTFAMIWTPSQNFTVNLAAMAPSSVRARWWNPDSGAFTAIANYSNSGTQAFTAPGSRILVLDAA